MNKPLFKLIYEEYLDRNNKITGSWSVYVNYMGGDILLYNTFSEEWAKIALKRLKDNWDSYVSCFINDEDVPVMFERDDAIYKMEYVFPEQSCVVGLPIEGNTHYAEYCPQGQKFDYIHDTIFFYKQGTCLVKANQLFMDGQLLLNCTQLKQVCDSIGQNFNALDYDANKLIQYIKNTYSNVKCYVCGGYSSYNIGGE